MTIVAPAILAYNLRAGLHLAPQIFTLLQCFSLLLLGASLSTLATLNFSQSLVVGLLAAPLSFVRPFSPPKSWPLALKVAAGLTAVMALVAVSPPAVLLAGSWVSGRSVGDVVAAAAWAWKVEKVWTGVTVWIVWWPAWVVGGIVLCSGMV